ncbi:MAG: dipeptidase [Acidimicrobiia bacterium]
MHAGTPVVDLHLHGPAFVPRPARWLWRLGNPRRPREVDFDALAAGGVDLAVATAVGDPIVTRLHPRSSPWGAVEAQLAAIERRAAAAEVAVVGSVDGALEQIRLGRRALLLGVEGLDALAGDPDGIDRWHARGIRVGVLVHLRDNDLGTISLPWQQYRLPIPTRRRQAPGLTDLGARVVGRMNDLGMLVDVAHADVDTVLAVVDAARAPVASTHTGARAVSDFPRYLTDDELRAIAGTGGVIGLWPYRGRRWGVGTIDELVAHARHVADLVGVDHLAVGTDTNGVPGLMAGYRGLGDLPLVLGALADAGFTAAELAAVAGGNALRVFRAVEAAASGP